MFSIDQQRVCKPQGRDVGSCQCHHEWNHVVISLTLSLSLHLSLITGQSLTTLKHDVCLSGWDYRILTPFVSDPAPTTNNILG